MSNLFLIPVEQLQLISGGEGEPEVEIPAVPELEEITPVTEVIFEQVKPVDDKWWREEIAV